MSNSGIQVHLADESGDSLLGALAGLSLTDAQEAKTAEKKPICSNSFGKYRSRKCQRIRVKDNGVGLNPVASFLPSAVEQVVVQTVDDLAQHVIPQYLFKLKRTRKFSIHKSHPLYIEGQRFKEKWGVSDEGFRNWQNLLSGWIDFPVVMLLNLSPSDHLPLKDMIGKSPTLSWLQVRLEKMKLKLENIIVLDIFPMVTNSLHSRALGEEPSKLRELLRESFALTKLSLKFIQPQWLISCQCCTRSTHEKWGFCDDELAGQLCSSVAEAQLGRVRRVEVGDHSIHVVLGMHPWYVIRHNESMETILAGLFAKVFAPFGAWQPRRAAL